MQLADGIVYFALIVLAVTAAGFKKLTVAGAITGAIVAVLIYAGGGLIAIAELAAFFILGSWSTSFGLSKKQASGLAEENKGRRTMWQVLANGGTAAFLGLLFLAIPQLNLPVKLMMAGSLAAATADTLSSELGNIYGKRFYNIITFKPDTRGLDGVISLEGTLAGVAGAGIIALIYFFGTDKLLFATFVLFSGTIGGLVDSVLGATLERRGWLNNNAVNFLNTLTGAIIAGVLSLLIK